VPISINARKKILKILLASKIKRNRLKISGSKSFENNGANAITTSIILDQRRIKKNGKFPVKLRVISDRIVRDYSTIFELTETDYKKLNAPRVSDEIQHIKRKSQQIVSGANLVIEKLSVFDFLKFEEEYININDKLFKIEKSKPVVYDQNGPKDHFDYTPFQKRLPYSRKIIPDPKAFL